MLKCLFVFVVAIITKSAGENEGNDCCPSGTFVSLKMKKCWVPNSNETSPLRLTCKKMIRLNSKYSMNSEGNIEIPIVGLQSQILERDKYCIGNMINNNTSVSITSAIICYYEEEAIIADEVLGYCMIISMIFLILTVIIYAGLSELRDLQGKSIISLSGSLATGFGILAIIKTMSYNDMNLCAVRGFLAYFFLISAFFWTNAISIQVLRSTRQASLVNRGWKEFFWYAVYSWGCPMVLTIIMAIVNFHPGNHNKPGIGLNHCWFIDKEQQWYYMYGVMSILISVNIFIFIYTSSIVWKHSFSSGHIQALRYRLTMTIRLIIVMGLLWIFAMIGSLMEKHIVWALLDIVNSLQGPLIFLVVVVFRKRAVKAMLRHGWLDCVSGPVEKYLAAGSDVEENIIQHTDVPMNDH